LRAVLRRSVVARGRWLIADGRKLGMGRTLPWYTDSLSHLSIDWGFTRRATLMHALLGIGSVTLIVSLALCLLFLLLCFPFLADLFELYSCQVSMIQNE
jgi:hypothetical protein